MLELRIGNEIVQGKVDFAFMKRANEKYGKVRTEKHEMNGKEHQEEVKTPGYEVIYEGLLNSNYEALLHFWDCVFASRDKIPTLEEIGTALYEKMPADGDIDDLFKEAFQALDNSGFFQKGCARLLEENEFYSESARSAIEDEGRRGRKGNADPRSGAVQGNDEATGGIEPGGEEKRQEIDIYEIIRKARQYLKENDVKKILSWDFNEYKALIQGATMEQIDELERAAQVALFNRLAQHKKGKLRVTQIFDAKKARKMAMEGDEDWKKAQTDPEINKKAKRAEEQAKAINEWAASGGFKFTPK
ncbi:tail assembly chaperone [Bacillus phage 000TH010]|uniref:Tail assembly chaperone n=1 Tax=Bacillus phage 000TH010 TaxID=2601652 RepID=A0A5P8PHP2_9CAUD|nr:tail assembly chaperone [Bacillus phage 000TH010]QFR56237.1 tail assembly chaperone [Bacillus phage 000TH010]